MSNSSTADARHGGGSSTMRPRRLVKLNYRVAASRASARDDNAPPLTPVSSETVVVDPRGDLKLVVGETKTVFQVCSRALARSASYWDTLLYGRFSKGQAQQNGSDWCIPFPEDDPDGMKLILDVVHHRHEALPDHVPCDLLFQVTVLADRYDMIGCLSTFWGDWCCDHSRKTMWKMAPQDLTEHLWLYHKLGDERGFRIAVRTLVFRAAINGRDELYLESRPPEQQYNLSDDANLRALGILGTY
jgi:hypothetical protein